MYASKGALTHEGIMGLTWRQFAVYLDAFGWLMNEQSDDGKKKNKLYDMRATANDPKLKKRKETLLEETKRKVEKHKRHAQKKMLHCAHE